MKSKKTPFRAFGQSAVSSFFPSGSSNSARDSRSRVSLSDFLDRKLHKSSAPSKSVQEKSKPFSSMVASKEVEVSVRDIKEEEGERTEIQDKVVFEQFKPTSTDKVDCTDTPSVSEQGTPDAANDELPNSRKRKNPFATVEHEERRTSKRFIVLGEDSKPKQAVSRELSTANTSRRPLYNHYANGRGWWGSDMEGVDNEEVGYREVWEGVGSTTLGGIGDWH